MPANAQPGKCYAKCSLGNVKAKPADTTITTYYRYTGDDVKVKYKVKSHPVRIDEFGKVVERLEIKVPKKKKNLSPNDLAMDTLYTYHAAVKERLGGFTEWREIVCAKDITPQLLDQIAAALSTEGFTSTGVPFDIGEPSKVSSDLKKALVKYQRENTLPIGQLDIQTLDALGVEY